MNDSHCLGGYKIFVTPESMPVLRSWRERLFSWPWRPWERLKMLSPSISPRDGEFLMIGGILHCNARSFANWKATALMRDVEKRGC